MEPDGTERSYSWPFMPFLGKKNRVWVHPESWASPAKPAQTMTSLRMPRHNNSMFVRRKCRPPSTVMSIAIKQDFSCARSVGRFGPPEEEKGVNTHVLPLPRKIAFSRAAWNLFDVGNQSVPTHVASHIPFASFPVLF